jgi:CBS domain-containing protein
MPRARLYQRSSAMRVKDVMTDDVKCCSLETNLAAAAKIMWEADCGAVPVTDGQNKVIGVITDRDICIAGATRSRTEGEIPVREVISKTLYSCSPNDDVRAALETMRSQQIRRLPVVGQDGRLAGIVSIHDIAVHARAGKGSAVPAEDVLDTFIAITAPSPAHMTISA